MNFVETLLSLLQYPSPTVLHSAKCTLPISDIATAHMPPAAFVVRLHEPHHQIIFRERDRTVALVSTRKANRDGRNQGGYYNATEGRLYPSEHRSHCY